MNHDDESRDAPVRYEERGAVALVTIHRPEVLNSLSTAVFRGLRAAMTRAQDNADIRALVEASSTRGAMA